MKRFTLTLAIICSVIAANSYAQVFTPSNSKLSAIAKVTDKGGWITFNDNFKTAPADVFSSQKAAFGLGSGDEMKLVKSSTDKIGYTHYKYQQLYKGIPVAGADYIIHGSNGKALTGNGNIVSGLTCGSTPQLQAKTAIDIALKLMNAERYMWENPQNEEMLRTTTGNQNATYYPEAKLVIFDKHFSGVASKYRLAWKVNVYAEKPLGKRDIYIDALSGEVIHTINDIKTTDVPGSAHTKYSGTQPITTDSTAPGQYRLRETSRSGIETYDMNTGTVYGSAVDFTDTDNDWNNINAQKDEVATDAHWGAEMTYDYYFTQFGRNSYDDAGAKLMSYVHYDVGYDNAFWDGFRMTYGDGSTYKPFTALDICGHEITHAVSDGTAGFVYQDESGALSEGFSDIFGTSVEFFALGSAGDWKMGEDIDPAGIGLRSINDPKSTQNPTTYHGQYWATGVFDNGGVHTNCSLASYWFYLLSQGGSGSNDLGLQFSVQPVGLDTAEAIAYRGLTIYLTSNSTYADARMATLQAAIDLYGSCSRPYIQASNAWYAVGVGQAVTDYDLSMYKITEPVTGCGLTTTPVSISAIYNGCNLSIPSGDTLYMNYVLDGGAVVTDTLVLSADINPGDTLNYTFAQAADASALGMHDLTCFITFNLDTISYNDTIQGYQFENRLFQNSDVALSAIVEPFSECHLTDAETVKVKVAFHGCDYLIPGSSIRLGYSVDGGTAVYDTLTTVANLLPDSTVEFTFAPTADLSAVGTHYIKAWTAFDIDSNQMNDTLFGYAVKNPLSITDTIITFDEANPSKNYVVNLGIYAHAFTSHTAYHTGPLGFQMTGGNAMAYYDLLEFPNGNNTWQINDFLSAKITFCVDATAWTHCNMKFDLKQTFGEAAYTNLIGPGDYRIASNLRVLVNNSIQVGGTYNPATAASDPYATYFVNLDAFAGTRFTVAFETRNIAKDTLGFKMDNAYLDNIRFREADFSEVGESAKLDNYVALYPNPSTGKLFIDYFANRNQDVTVNIMDITGRIIQSNIESANTGLNRFNCDLSNNTAGIYFISLRTTDGVFNSKVVKE
ncbi:MAG: M4 family metallopeptidase [Bacteroidota bacterium]